MNYAHFHRGLRIVKSLFEFKGMNVLLNIILTLISELLKFSNFSSEAAAGVFLFSTLATAMTSPSKLQTGRQTNENGRFSSLKSKETLNCLQNVFLCLFTFEYSNSWYTDLSESPSSTTTTALDSATRPHTPSPKGMNLGSETIISPGHGRFNIECISIESNA